MTVKKSDTCQSELFVLFSQLNSFFFFKGIEMFAKRAFYRSCVSRTKLYLLSKCIEIQEFVRYVDYRFYQNLVSVLVPDVLRPIPST